MVGTILFLHEIAGSLEPSEKASWFFLASQPLLRAAVHVISCLGGVCVAGRGVAIQKPPPTDGHTDYSCFSATMVGGEFDLQS